MRDNVQSPTSKNRTKIAAAQDSVQRIENKTGLPDNLKSGIESMSGIDMSSVQVKRNSSEPAKVGALAYAQGNQIHLAPGQEKHLPHEAWHVVQQAQGRVKPTTSVNGKAVNDNPGLEREADVMGGKAMQLKDFNEFIPRDLISGGKTIQHIRLNRKNDQKGDPIQRMVLLAIDNKDHEDDLVIMTNLNYALSYAGGPVVGMGGSPDFSGMSEDEDLMILEHGSAGKIQDYTPDDLLAVLTADGKEVPERIGGIIVLACEAGLAAEKGKPDTSLVAKLASGLAAKGLDIVVDGKIGLAITSASTGERAVKPSQEDEYMKLQHQIVVKHGFAKEIIDVQKIRPDLVGKYGPVIVKTMKGAKELIAEDYGKNSGLYQKAPD
ncbi:MAG: DUF4157 domain-containing protein, partial [Cyclobacteriaceae bacterium]